MIHETFISLHKHPIIRQSRGFRKKAGVQYPPSTSTMTEDYGPAFKLPSLGPCEVNGFIPAGLGMRDG